MYVAETVCTDSAQEVIYADDPCEEQEATPTSRQATPPCLQTPPTRQTPPPTQTSASRQATPPCLQTPPTRQPSPPTQTSASRQATPPCLQTPPTRQTTPLTQTSSYRQATPPCLQTPPTRQPSPPTQISESQQATPTCLWVASSRQHSPSEHPKRQRVHSPENTPHLTQTTPLPRQTTPPSQEATSILQEIAHHSLQTTPPSQQTTPSSQRDLPTTTQTLVTVRKTTQQPDNLLDREELPNYQTPSTVHIHSLHAGHTKNNTTPVFHGPLTPRQLQTSPLSIVPEYSSSSLSKTSSNDQAHPTPNQTTPDYPQVPPTSNKTTSDYHQSSLTTNQTTPAHPQAPPKRDQTTPTQQLLFINSPKATPQNIPETQLDGYNKKTTRDPANYSLKRPGSTSPNRDDKSVRRSANSIGLDQLRGVQDSTKSKYPENKQHKQSCSTKRDSCLTSTNEKSVKRNRNPLKRELSLPNPEINPQKTDTSSSNNKRSLTWNLKSRKLKSPKQRSFETESSSPKPEVGSKGSSRYVVLKSRIAEFWQPEIRNRLSPEISVEPEIDRKPEVNSVFAENCSPDDFEHRVLEEIEPRFRHFLFSDETSDHSEEDQGSPSHFSPSFSASDAVDSRREAIEFQREQPRDTKKEEVFEDSGLDRQVEQDMSISRQKYDHHKVIGIIIYVLILIYHLR